MNPGDFDQRITIQTYVPALANTTAVVDAFGQRVASDSGDVNNTECVVDDIQNELGGVEQDYFGQRTIDFTTLAVVWAKVEEKRGSEGEQSNQIVATRMVEFLIRYRSDVNEQMRIVYRGNIYEIQSIISGDDRKKTLRIHTKLSD